MKKKNLAYVVVAILMLSMIILGGCAPAPEAPAEEAAPAEEEADAPSESEAEEASEPVTLTWVYPGWDTPEQEAAVTQIISDFEASHPNITIDLQNQPWNVFHEKLIISLQGNNAPDGGYLITRWLPEVYAMGKLTDLSDFREELELSDWFESTWLDGKFEGKYYSVPNRREPYVFFYNTKLFEAAGIDEFPATMSEFVEDMQTLTSDGKFGVCLAGAQDSTLPAYYLNFLYAFNGYVLDPDDQSVAINDELNAEALQFYVDLVNEYKVTQPSVIADTREQCRQLFMAEQAAVTLDSLWAIGTLKEMAPTVEWGIGMIPQVEGRERRSLMSGWDLVIFADTDHPEEAKEFIKFFTEPDNMAAAVVTLPVRASVYESERFSDPSYDPWKEALKYGVPNPQTKYYEATMLIIGEALQNAISGTMSVEESLENAEQQVLDLSK